MAPAPFGASVDPFGDCSWCHPDDPEQCGVCLRPNADPALVGAPRGSTVHRVRLTDHTGAKRETTTVLTGWRHLLAPAPEEDAKGNKGMVFGECGTKGRPYVWKGVGIRATSVSSGVTCPKCLATPRYKRLLGQGMS